MMSTAQKAARNNELSAATNSSIEIDLKDPTLFYLSLKYNIYNIDIYENSNNKNSFDHIGHSLIRFFAKIFIKIAGERTIHIDDVDFPIPDLNLDFNIIKTLKINNILIEYNKEFDISMGNRADFSFIKAFTLTKDSGQNPLIISYDKKQNNCQQKCLNFKIQNGDIFEFMKNGHTMVFKPLLTISSLPAVDELKLDGQIEMQIGLKLPF